MKSKSSILLTTVITVLVSGASSDPLILCTKTKDHDPCQYIDRSNDFSCKIAFNDLTCLLYISQGNCSFGRIPGDLAILGATKLDKNIEVIGEFREGLDGKKEETKYDMVVITKEPSESITQLRGKSLCHPGITRLKTTRHLVNQLEEEILKNSSFCDSTRSKTTVGKYLAALSEFFGPSCRPGSWVDDVATDAELKKQYGSLCDKCTSDDTNDKCSAQNIKDPFDYAVQCFLNGGDVAITTAHVVTKRKTELNKFFYLCKDGHTRPISSNIPCYWSRKPWDLLVANTKDADEVRRRLYGVLPVQNSDQPTYRSNKDVKSHLEKVLGVQNNVIINSVDTKALQKYVEHYYNLPKESICPNDDIKWCTTSDFEHEKCLWFDKAALMQGINPGVTCVKHSDQLECVEAIANGSVDTATIGNDLGLIARRKNLVPVAFPETKAHNLTKTMLVVKDAMVPYLTSFKEVKGKFGCFSAYGNIAFVSWLNALQDHDALAVTCNASPDYTNLLSSGACMPGLVQFQDSFNAQLCQCESGPNSKTAVECSASENNLNYGNSGALRCLDRNKDSFAVISSKNLPKDTDNYRILCKNGTLAIRNGLNVDDDCYLSVTSNTELLIKQDNPKKDNIIVSLHSFEKLFGANVIKTFELFNRFNGKEDLLFEDATPGIVFNSDANPYVKNYVNAFRSCRTSEPDAAASNLPHTFMFVAIAFLIRCFMN